MKSIFISRPSWIPDEFKAGVDNFYKLLDTHQLSPRTIGVSDYPNESPMDDIIKLMKKCHGTIVLGIPQIEINKGKIKDQKIVPNQYLSTEWNHIEAAIAHTLEHPILIIQHLDLKRGIFDRGALNVFIYSVDMRDSSWSLSVPIIGALNNWQEKLKI
ncbi:MAG: hypothetical protein V4585_02150 [Bacteroidota bacterium]